MMSGFIFVYIAKGSTLLGAKVHSYCTTDRIEPIYKCISIMLISLNDAIFVCVYFERVFVTDEKSTLLLHEYHKTTQYIMLFYPPLLFGHAFVWHRCSIFICAAVHGRIRQPIIGLFIPDDKGHGHKVKDRQCMAMNNIIWDKKRHNFKILRFPQIQFCKDSVV